ncbi:MAG: Na/Pi symporter [Myxococcales bacterium]|nr:Na/Pi symporter [Myxococcales bacterium]MDH3482997.1 Na/Pi symporter [Myxococcales bacterium]
MPAAPADLDSIGAIVLCLGGLGFFLLGMVVLTEGLRALAGHALRRVLTRFTRSPLSGAVTGAMTTAVVQSSSATTVAAVGFVGAGLLTFPQAFGIVLGANVGTTITGWFVALLGFKLSLGTAALPIVLVGVLMRLFTRGRASSAGFALAGFGLIFVGISFLQEGMGGLVGVITPESFPPDTWTGRLFLFLFGLVFTVVTQSSSAGVALALATVNASAMTVQQAAAAVIGMNVGTTATAVLATIGGSVHARRTGYAHAMFNVLTGFVAFAILAPFMHALEYFAPQVLASEPELILVGFHTFFNVLGVMIALPFASQFAGLMVRLVPMKPFPFASSLDYSLLDSPAAALDALGTTLADLSATAFEMTLSLLSTADTRGMQARLAHVREALSETRGYVESIRTSTDEGWTYQRHLAAMHVIDHLDRLADRCADSERWPPLKHDRQLAAIARKVVPAADVVREAIVHGEQLVAEEDLEATWRSVQDEGHDYRERALEQVAVGGFDTGEAAVRLDAARSVRRVAYHMWRIAHHLNRCRTDREPPEMPEGSVVPPHVEAEPPDPS